MARDYIIRHTADADLEQVTDIYAVEVATGRASFETEPPTVDEMRSRYDTLRQAGYSHLVACRHDVVLGYAYTSSYRPRVAYRYTVENSVYVRRDARGAGIATDLLKALIADCRDKPFRQMVAVIGDSANTASIALHHKLGFSEVGVLKKVGYKFETWIDTVIMQRPL